MTDTTFPAHVFDALGVDPAVLDDRIGGTVRVAVKRPADGPITLMTVGASLLPTDSGERVELAVEVVAGQEGAGRVALEIVCDDIATNHRVPPVGAPWRNSEPFLRGTRIAAILATPSRWGASFDEVRSADGELLGHVRTLRLLTIPEATYANANGWDALVEAAGSVDALLDVTRDGAVEAGGIAGNAPVFLSKMHAEHPPRWITFSGQDLQSVVGLESDEYMQDSANIEIRSVDAFVAAYPWVAGFVRSALPGQTALFTDDSGAYVLEDD
ncbi:hypothetical protein GCM10009846_26200 [Agrococcus versicolor]|uniref:3-octaprenyl-4-hydroxybenzoate carboxy-lyase n=1 Tax=Agrococcus versicolor TaxID=501482 RepID=A0ABN3AX77_9MICO